MDKLTEEMSDKPTKTMYVPLSRVRQLQSQIEERDKRIEELEAELKGVKADRDNYENKYYDCKEESAGFEQELARVTGLLKVRFYTEREEGDTEAGYSKKYAIYDAQWNSYAEKHNLKQD